MGNVSAGGLKPGSLACLVNKERGYACVGIIKEVQPSLSEPEAGRILMEGVKIGGTDVNVGGYRFTPVEVIRQPDGGGFTSPHDIPLEGWDDVYSVESNMPSFIIYKLRSGEYKKYADFLAAHLGP